MCCVHKPSHLEETFIVLELRSVPNTLQGSVSIIVQDRRNLRRPNVQAVKVPDPSFPLMLDSRVEERLTW